MKKKYLIIVAAVAFMCFTGQTAKAQTKDFNMGKWLEIQISLLKELNSSYVDTLPINKMWKSSIDSMLKELDPYTIYVPEEENENFEMLISHSYGGIGAIIHKKKEGNVIINEPYYGSPAHLSGLRCGDEIIEIDGVPTIGLEVKESSDRMKGKPGTTVVFKVKKARTGEIVKIKVVRKRIHMPDIEYACMLDDTTGYVLQSGFTEGVSEQLKEKFLDFKKQGMKRFVLDLRGNGGGLMSEAVNIISLFVPKGTVAVSSKGRNPRANHEYRTQHSPIDTITPIIVMIDGGSASASEIVSGGLQDLKRATIMGTTSYGKGSVQSIRELPYNGQMKITTAKYYTPSGVCVHGVGVTPDIEVEVPSYSRLVFSLVINGIIDEFAMQYAREHDDIPGGENFRFSDEDFERFIEFAKSKEFDYRSEAKTSFDQMKEELKEDGLEEAMKDEIAALEEALDIDKEKFIRMKKDEIIPFLEEEIVTRFYFQEAGIKVRLRYDKQLKKALGL